MLDLTPVGTLAAPGSLQRCEFATCKDSKATIGLLMFDQLSCLENPAPIAMTSSSMPIYADLVDNFCPSGQTWSDVAGRLGAQRHQGLHLFGAVSRCRVARASAAS